MAEPSATDAALAAFTTHRETILAGFAIAGAIGGAIGFTVTQWRERQKDKRAQVGNWTALAIEIEKCREMADIYLRHRLQAPSYRLPTLAYTTAFPALLAMGAANRMQTFAIADFYTEVESMNRGMDQAAANVGQKQQDEFDRNVVKAKKIASDGGAYVAARKSLPPSARDAER